MYLKTLEMQGFKSFPDKTVIEFRPGVTGIVGANGSGKSNISDAVRWVLGEMSPKSLRGGKMEDVIFNGTARRRPAGFAEVVMTIDNSDGRMKIDYDEVSVARRLYRSGESEYYINKKQCRLKDVIDLFLNTGIGREGYSVISQGKIAEIISQKGDERREVFEEAAGISRFRYRKTEAQNKLEKVKDNAVRIADILGEVEGRLPALEAQSEKALKFTALDSEKRELELAVSAERLRVIDGERDAIAKDYDARVAALEEISARLASLEKQLDDMYLAAQRDNIEADRLRSGIAEKNDRASTIAARLSVLENDIHHYEEKIAELSTDIGEADGRMSALGEASKASKEKLSSESERLSALKADFEAKNAFLAEIDSSLTLLRSKSEEIDSRIAALTEEKQKGELENSSIEGFGRAREDRLALLADEKAKLEGEAADRRRETDEASAKLEADTEAQKNENAVLGRLRLSAYELGSKREEKGEARQSVRMKLLETEQRRETLSRMDRLLEGFSGSVKEVMNAAERGELRGICGPLSKLIKTDEKYITAIETSLGGGMQHIVCEDDAAAKAAIDFLKRTKAGRATFLPLSTIRPDPIKADNITDKGFFGLASDLVECDERFRPAAVFMLGRTVIAENIDSAGRIASGRGYGIRVVTLDGQMINAGGSFTGGQQLHRTGILSRNADIAALDAQIADMKEKQASLDCELSEIDRSLGETKKNTSESEKRLEELNIAVMRSKNELALKEELGHAADERLEELDREYEKLVSSAREETEKQASISARREEIDILLSKASEEKSSVGASLDEKTRSREALLGEVTSAAGELAATESRLEVLREAAESDLRELEQSSEKTREKKDLLDSIILSVENAKKEISASITEKEALDRECDESKKALESVRARLADYDKNSFEKRDGQKSMTAEKENLIDAVSRLESKISNIDREKESFIAHLREEYDLDADSEELKKIPDGRARELGGRARLGTLRQEIKRLGPVNLESIEELKATRERFEFLRGQYADIESSKEGLEKLIVSLEKTMREMFMDTFEKIRESFKESFTELFGGGSADIVITDPDNVLSSGIEINIQPPGKLVKSLSLLSGGEQAFVAIALYFALLKVNPSPFCIFDEIESALDEANVIRFGEYLRRNSDRTQFIVITHRRGTMESADILYGIAMQEKGVSDYIKLDSDQLKEGFVADEEENRA